MKKAEENNYTYKKQIKFRTNFVGKAKEDFFSTLNVKFITNDKTFWKFLNLYLSKKSRRNENVTLLEEN